MTLEVTLNDDKRGVELLFSEELPIAFANRLKTYGFKQSLRQSLKWYAPQHPAYVNYAKALQKTLLKGEAFDSAHLQPSFEPSEENINRNKFSYVTISYTKDENEIQDNYVIFDSYKNVATAIATRFGKSIYQAAFKEVDVFPRNYKRKSRTLLKEGKVIKGNFSTPLSVEKQHRTDPLANKQGVYTPKSAGSHYEKIDIPFPKAAKFEAHVRMVKGSDGRYRYGIRIINDLNGHEGVSFAPHIKDKSFLDRKKALKAAITYIIQDTKDNEKALRAIEQFAVQHQIKLNSTKPPVIQSQTPTDASVPIIKKGEHKQVQNTTTTPDYIDRVIAHLHEYYANGKRPTKGQIENLKGALNIPNLGMLWEAAELSWLLWYKQIYKEPIPFELRLEKMIHFWNHLQPTYAYSDSSKELFRQYSTPCPIGAMVAQYTGMDQAKTIFEPSAGNGLLLLGADPRKTHVNEIDKTRLTSLKFQGFSKITSHNAAKPFPPEMEKAYDVVVTNPPFSRWEEDSYNKEHLIRNYFNGQIGLKRIRLEHLMVGLALHTMKDHGRAAIIIMGHIYFSDDGFIARYRPFFNWLYRHYKVDDVINMNSFKLYNKQGAITETMLILIGGRKPHPEGVAPKEAAAPYLNYVVESFEQLWERIASHIGYSLRTIIHQLQIELT